MGAEANVRDRLAHKGRGSGGGRKMFLGGRKMFLRRRSMRPGSIKITPTRDTINNQLSNCSCYGNTLWLAVTFGRVNIVCHPLVIINRMYVKHFPLDHSTARSMRESN